MTELKHYLRMIKNPDFDPMPIEEEREIVRLAANGNSKAFEKVVKSCQRFIIAAAAKHKGIDFDDLIQIGNEALISSFRTFDYQKFIEGKCNRFLTYAARRIYQAMALAAKKNTTELNMSESVIKKMLRLSSKVAETGEEDDNTILKIAKSLRIQNALARRLYLCAMPSTSLEAVASGDDKGSIKDTLKSADDVEDEIIKKIEVEKVLAAMSVLSPIEKKIITDFYGLGPESEINFSEIGKKYGFSREWARHVHHRGIEKIKQEIANQEGETDDF